MSRKVLVFAGSIRSGSLHRKLARQAAAELRKMGTEVTLADLSDYPMPLYDGDLEAGEGAPQSVRAFKQLVRAHDAFVIASPEYNGSFSALLKNAIDWASRPEPGEKSLAAFRGKAAAILSASPGPGGGQRGLRQLRDLLEMMAMTVVPTQLAIPRAHEAFDSEGNLARPEDRLTLEHIAAELAGALQAGAAA
jgi:chromate reductase